MKSVRKGAAVSRALLFVPVLSAVLALGGCAVGWGQKYEVVHKDSRSITVTYDSLVADFRTFAKDVDAHCAQFGKEAVPEQRKDARGVVQTITFRCE